MMRFDAMSFDPNSAQVRHLMLEKNTLFLQNWGFYEFISSGMDCISSR